MIMQTKIKFPGFLLLAVFIFSGTTAQTPQNIVDQIKKQITCPWADETVDTFKAGNPDQKVTGIATCMFADMVTLKKAVDLGCNFIITHEPVFYNHLDETTAYQNDPVFREKMQFIEENGLVIFRLHDHIHRTEPDGISVGMIDKLGLKPYSKNGSLTFFEIPETKVETFANELKTRLNMKTVRVLGNPEMKFSKTAFMAGAPGGQRQIKMLQNENVEVLIGGEAPEWETYLYVNDAAQQRKKKAVIFLGHIKSEEAGMEYCAEWLQTFVKDIPIHFIENKPNFNTL
jgi:putative NIF3 family GTP cyclohydrolase 1 type 2